ncbi:AMP-dependent synthetase [Alsobacter metallidurans]|uniref:AMP-dependent synthetase n=1 Tax=Alsobacter metallidurans TaxID=340221 RepID=A0A917I8N4_9HYPH|nr:AMP-binding protein [Alsobacter metallidurans]GGH24711.1 AMP-dependent synthetase [Alsobacter metallidurans]
MPGALWRKFEATSRRFATRSALVQGPRDVSFGELRSAALAGATDLAAAGVCPGDRCLFWASNSAELAASILACWRLGAIVGIVNDEAPATHFLHAAGVLQPVLCIVESRLAEAAERAVTTRIHVLQPTSAECLASTGPGLAHDHEPASVFFTSGSTGAPKGVTQSHANLVAGCQMVAGHLGLTIEDRILCPIPWSFDYGYGQLLTTVLLGVTQILPEARGGVAICNAISSGKPTVFAGIPSIFALLTRGVSPLRGTDLRSLRLIMNTGGKIPPAIFADMAGVFNGAKFSLNYGMTETYRTAGLPVDLADRYPESVGFAYPGVSVAIIREDGTEAAIDEMGEIVHRGVGVFLGYWGDPSATEKVRRPDPLWRYPGVDAPKAVFSGDLGWKDASGLLYVKCRRDRLVKSMGVRVSPDEVEELLRGTGLVADAIVFGLPHDLIGEQVVAAVVAADEGSDPLPELKAAARRIMSPYMQPRAYRSFQSFPLTPNGKPDVPRIRALMLDDR